MNAGDIAHLISSFRYSYDSEDMLQEHIAAVLANAKVSAKREVRINDKDRLDFLTEETEDAGPVAIEVKIHDSRPSVMSQLHRYAQSDLVSAIVLVTTKARHHGMPESISGKQIYVASLLGGSFA